MSAATSSLAFSLNDTVAGQPLTLDNVDLPTLRLFLEEVEKLVKGDEPGASLTSSKVKLENGSVRAVITAGCMLISNVGDDMARLERTGDLDLIQPKRAQIIETWQRRAQRQPTLSYTIADPANPAARPLKVEGASPYQHGAENSWVTVEKYLAGRVVDLGGKQEPNVHLVLADTGRTIQVSATEKQLAAEEENQLYRDVTLRVQAQQHLRTRELRDVKLLEFLHRTEEVDPQALERLWKNGREAWKDVPSATAWVEALRNV